MSRHASRSVILFPARTNENRYIERIFEILRKGGFHTSGISVRTVIHDLIHHRHRYVLLNWIENQTRERGILGFCMIVGFCELLRLLGFKLIWVHHNRQSHQLVSASQISLNRRAMAYLRRRTHRTVCHGQHHAATHNLTYVPHPLYDTPPPETTLPRSTFLIFGRIAVYKNIEALLEEWPQLPLHIAGPFEQGCLEACRAIITRRHLDVVLEDRFIPEPELNTRISGSLGVILSNDGASSIVSGTVFHAISLGTPVYTTSRQIVEETGPSLKGLQAIPAWRDLPAQPELSRDEIIENAHHLHGDQHVLQALTTTMTGIPT